MKKRGKKILVKDLKKKVDLSLKLQYFIIFGILAILILIGLLYFSRITGRVTFDIQPIPEKFNLNDKLNGSVILDISPGEIIPKDTLINLNLFKGDDLLVNKDITFEEFLEGNLEPAGIINSSVVCENISVDNITQDCNQVCNPYEECIDVTNPETNEITQSCNTNQNCTDVCEDINTSKNIQNCSTQEITNYYFNQPGSYQKEMKDLIDYSFNEPGEYTFIIIVPSSGVKQEKTIIVENNGNPDENESGNLGNGGIFPENNESLELNTSNEENNSENFSLNFGTMSNPGDIDSCQNINTPGIYTMTRNLEDSDFNVTSCFNISVSDVVLDCNGYYIKNSTFTNNGIAIFGVYAGQNLVNITVKNCNISIKNPYGGNGIYFNRVNDSLIFNNTLDSNKSAITGVGLSYSNRNNISSSTINNSYYGIRLDYSLNNNLNDMLTCNNQYIGIFIYKSNNTNINNINSFNNSQDGINLMSTNNNSLNNITTYNNSEVGFHLYSGSNYNSLNNIITYNNKQNGVFLEFYTNNNTLNNINSFNNSQNGIYLYSNSNNNSLNNITTYNNSQNGIYILSSSNNNSLNNITTYNNSQNGISIGSNSNNNYLNNITTFNNFLYGIYLINENSNSLSNINMYNQSTGIYSDSSSYNTFNNLRSINNHNGFYISSSNNNNFSSINISNDLVASDSYGFYISSSNKNNFSSVSINNCGYGFDLNSGSNNIFNYISIGNGSYGSYGLYFISASKNNLSSIITYNYFQGRGIYLTSSSNYNIFNNLTSYNNEYGIFVAGPSSNNNFSSIITYNNSEGIYLSSSNYNNFSSIIAYNNSEGIYLSSSFYNNLSSITSYNNLNYGLYLSNSSYNNISSITSYNNNFDGLYINYISKFNNLNNISTYSNNRYGIYLQSSSNNNNLYNIYLNNSLNSGIQIDTTNSSNFFNCNLSLNTQYDVHLSGSSINNSFINCTYVSTKESVEAGSLLYRKWYYSGIYVNDSLGNPIGNVNISIYNNTNNIIYSNLTNESGYNNYNNILLDYINNGGTISFYSNFTINITKSGYSIATKSYNLTIQQNIPLEYFNLTDINAAPEVSNVIVKNNSGTVGGNIKRGDNVTINVTVTDVNGVSSVWVNFWKGIAGITEIIWQGFFSFVTGNIWSITAPTNSSWSFGQVNYTIYSNDSQNNTQSYNYSLNFVSGFNITNCSIITEPGTYNQINNIIPTGTSGNNACLNIITSNVELNCNGYTISNPTFNLNGIYAGLNLVNITIKNCNISLQKSGNNGILLSYINDSSIINNSINSTGTGLYLYKTNRINISLFTSFFSQYGVYLELSKYNNLNNIITYNNSQYGVNIYSNSNQNNFYNITTYNNSQNGIYIYGSNQNNFYNITTYNNSQNGIYIFSNSNQNNFYNITTYNNSQNGIYLNSVTNNNISLLTTYNSQNGIYIYGSNQNNFNNITTYNNSQNGINLSLSNNNIISNLNLNQNSKYGISISSSNNTIINNITLIDNLLCGVYEFSSRNNTFILGNINVTNNEQSICLVSSSNNSIKNINITYDGTGNLTISNYSLNDVNCTGMINSCENITSENACNKYIDSSSQCTWESSGFDTYTYCGDISDSTECDSNTNGACYYYSSHGDEYCDSNYDSCASVDNENSCNFYPGCEVIFNGQVFDHCQEREGYVSGNCVTYGDVGQLNCTLISNSNDCNSNTGGSCTWISNVFNYGNSINNIFTNVSYDKTKEFIYTGNSLTRKWYYQAYANYTNGTNAIGANISIFNISGNIQNSSITDSNGLIPVMELIEYINNGGTRSYYSNYTINSTISGYSISQISYNLSLILNKLDDSFTMSYSDTISPNVILTLPVDNSYSNRTNISFTGNFDDNSQLKNTTLYIWNSSGNLINQTNVSISGVINSSSILVNLPNNDSYKWNYLTCDSNSNCRFNETNRTIVIDQIKPTFTLNSNSDNSSTRVWRNNIFVNVSLGETNFKNLTIKLFYSNSTPVTNSVITTISPSGIYTANFTDLSYGDYKFNMTCYDLAENKNKSITYTVTLIGSEERILLHSGWNLISLRTKTNATNDINISIHTGWNLIGTSSDENLNVEDLKFTSDSDGIERSWNDAVINNETKPYLSYYDSDETNSSLMLYKYTGESSLGMDDSMLRSNRGYWLYAEESGNLTIPAASIGGSAAGETYQWSSLRFTNGTQEMNVTEAGLGGQIWIDETLQYYGCNFADDEVDCSLSINWGLRNIPDIATGKNNISSWQGIWIKSLQNNITLIKQN